MGRTSGQVSAVAAMALLLASAGAGATTVQQADVVYVGANVVTMDADQPTAKAVAVKGDDILAVGTNAEIQRHVGPNTRTVRLDGATVLPGFIDPHSHFLGYAFFTDAKNWLDVSSVNLFFKPLPDDPRCKDPTDPQVCFIPVRSQDDVIERITKAAKKGKPVYAMSYDPSRLGHGKSCPGPASRVGFECPNFENGKSRATLDAISTEVEIYVSSQSGHIAYANTKALRKLNICGTGVEDKKTCREPIINPVQEKSLAKSGQLDEDLALYGDFILHRPSAEERPGLSDQIHRPRHRRLCRPWLHTDPGRCRHGWRCQALPRPDDGRSALSVHGGADDVRQRQRQVLGNGPVGPRSRADDQGSRRNLHRRAEELRGRHPAGLHRRTQRALRQCVPAVHPAAAFRSPIRACRISRRRSSSSIRERAHANGYPIMLHQNGDQAIKNSIRALELAQAEGTKPFRDIVLHAPFLSSTLLARLKALNDPVSFLMPNIYFWGLPLCQQVLGPEVFTRRYTPYPARSAKSMGLKVTLHTDSPVNPPDPLFTIWVAKTRKVQQPAWYPNANRGACPTVAGPQEVISIEQRIRGFTANAAWQYGLLNKRGTITAGKAADMVVLSKNPLAMESNPDELRHVRVLGTVHSGHYRKNPLRFGAPIWPADVE